MKIAIWEFLYAALPRWFLSQPNINVEVDRCALLHVELFIATKFYFSVLSMYGVCASSVQAGTLHTLYTYLFTGAGVIVPLLQGEKTELREVKTQLVSGEGRACARLRLVPECWCLCLCDTLRHHGM